MWWVGPTPIALAPQGQVPALIDPNGESVFFDITEAAPGNLVAGSAQLNYDKAAYLKSELSQSGIGIPFAAPTFNEFVARFPDGFTNKYEELSEKHIIAGIPLECYYPELVDHYLLCATETLSKEDMDLLVREVTS